MEPTALLVDGVATEAADVEDVMNLSLNKAIQPLLPIAEERGALTRV